MTYEILAIVGSILIVLLSINAYFFKEMVNNTNEIRIRLEVWISKHSNTDKVAERNAADIANIRERLHKVEGGHLQLIQFIEDYYNDKKNK